MNLTKNTLSTNIYFYISSNTNCALQYKAVSKGGKKRTCVRKEKTVTQSIIPKVKQATRLIIIHSKQKTTRDLHST